MSDPSLVHKQRVVELKRKMKLLKQAVKEERTGNQHLEDELFRTYEEIKRRETEGKRRDDKNQGLLLEIRMLRDTLIKEKTQREEQESRLEGLVAKEKEQGQQPGGLSASNYFGLRGLFQR